MSDKRYSLHSQPRLIHGDCQPPQPKSSCCCCSASVRYAKSFPAFLPGPASSVRKFPYYSCTSLRSSLSLLERDGWRSLRKALASI